MAERLASICNKCAHDDCFWRTVGTYQPPILACITFKQKGTTQADRIRAMSDEELAEWLERFTDCDSGLSPCRKYCKGNTCFVAILKWLQSPVDGGAE